MAKNLKKLTVWVLMISMLLSMVVPVAALETAYAPEVTVQLTPGKDTDAQESKELEQGTYVRKVTATASDVATEVKVNEGEITGIQPALKFDRNSTADQKTQKAARDLYTDNSHFTDPASIKVAGAPEGYPFQYVGSGDYSGHYISVVRVVYKRDADGNAIKDENGNYVIEKLRHMSSDVDLYYKDQPATNPDGPFHYASASRPVQLTKLVFFKLSIRALLFIAETKAVSLP